jgi:cell division protease FtsH
MLVFKWLTKAKQSQREPLRPRIEAHLGGDSMEGQTVSHLIRQVERVSIQLVADTWLEASRPTGTLVGYSCSSYYSEASLAVLLVNNDLFLGPVEREQLDSGRGQTLDCVKQGIYLLHHNGQAVVLLFRPATYRTDLPVLEVMARDRDTGRAALTDLLAEAERRNVYRGEAVSLERAKAWSEDFFIRFHELRPTERKQIVLPEEIILVIERNVLGLLRHSATLRKAGRSTRHGLLFHGPPGTGKTMMVRYLASCCKDHTVILLTGRQLGLIRESCQIARLLAPSIVVLEDVDLVAHERSENNCPMILHELMDEMDGLGTQAECIFLLTTNRPEVLEPALSARPGRIDQAVEFPLPDADGRRRLFEVYGNGLDLSTVDVVKYVAKTDGVSPAFIEELLRKAALLAAHRGETGEPLPLRDDDIEQALRELVFFGGELTQKLLGYRTGHFGYQAART